MISAFTLYKQHIYLLLLPYPVAYIMLMKMLDGPLPGEVEAQGHLSIWQQILHKY